MPNIGRFPNSKENIDSVFDDQRRIMKDELIGDKTKKQDIHISGRIVKENRRPVPDLVIV